MHQQDYPKETIVDAMLQTRTTRLEALTAVAALAGLAGGIMGSRSSAVAQEAPAAVSEPVWEVLGSATDFGVAPGLTLELARFTWMPGYAQELHTHNAVDVVYVLSGEVAWRVDGGEARVVRPAASGTPTPPETLASGAEALLGVGDAIVFDYGYQQVWHAGRTVGNAPVVMLFADLYDPSKPITVYAEDLATPTS
jgi:uncharacterized cupin superfamily protein